MSQKQWTTKSDFESGSLTNIIVPENLNELELKRLNLSGNGVWIFDAGKKVDWKQFFKTDPTKNVFYRDDFRDNSLEAWVVVGGTWNCASEYMRGTGSVDWKTNRARVGSASWTDLDILFKGYLSNGAQSHRLFLRADEEGSGFCAYMLGVTGIQTEQARVCNGSVLENTVISGNHVTKGLWYWFRVQIYTSGSNVVGRIKWWYVGDNEPGSWKASHTWLGIWRSAGCFSVGRHTADPGEQNRYDSILIKAKE